MSCYLKEQLDTGISALILPSMAISQGIEEEDISFARELFPKTRQHGLALGIHQLNDEEGDLEEGEEDDGDAEKEEKVRMIMRRQDGKENKRQEQEEEMSEHESDLSSASESVSLEVVGQSLDFRSLDSLLVTSTSTGAEHWQE